MLSSNNQKKSYDIETTNKLFEQLSVSLDNKHIKHKNGTSRPKLKRLLKIKYSSSLNNSNSSFCSRCKRETLISDKDEQNSILEKEVEVEKDSIQFQKKVAFASFHHINNDERSRKVDKAENNSHEEKGKEQFEKDAHGLSESAASFQTVFFTRRPSIIGDNEFWLPKYSSQEENSASSQPTSFSAAQECKISQADHLPSDIVEPNADLTEQLQIDGVTKFLKCIFHRTAKEEVKVLKVIELIDGTLAALTEEHFFQCQIDSINFYKVLDVIALKDVQRVFVSDNCLMLVLEIGRVLLENEWKEYVPGFTEKTESLVSLMVYALSRIKKFLPDVTRLPTQFIPTCGTIELWLARQNENVLFDGFAITENISHFDHDLLDENFMVKTSLNEQFHPVRIFLRSGNMIVVCNGGCDPNDCKYTLSFELKSEITRVKRESHPWPNCFRISTHNLDLTLSSSSMASVNDLLEKMYYVIECKNQESVVQHALIFVTDFYLQFFAINRNKDLICGFPLLNLEIKGDQPDNSCTIDSQGVEAEDTDELPLQNRWKLTFLSLEEKMKFLVATSERLV